MDTEGLVTIIRFFSFEPISDMPYQNYGEEKVLASGE